MRTHRKFQSTPSVKRVTLIVLTVKELKNISIHTLCEEGDTNSWRGGNVGDYISIHTLCEEGDSIDNKFTYKLKISIHTLCEEGDDIHVIMISDLKNFNPHPL